MSVTPDLSEETNLALNQKYIEFAENVIFYIVTTIGDYIRNWKSEDLSGLVEELAFEPTHIEFVECIIFHIVATSDNLEGDDESGFISLKSNDLKSLIKEIAMIVRSSLEDETFGILYERFIELTDLLELTSKDDDELIDLTRDIYNHVIGNIHSLQKLGFDDIESAQNHFVPMLITLYAETVLNSNIKSANKKQ